MARRTLVLIASATLVIAIGVIGLAASRYAGDPKPHSDTESAETTVTAQEGGSLSLSGATIFVPPGAISADAQLVASIKAAPPTEVSGSNSFGEFTPVAVPIEFQLLGAEILNPLQISFVVPPDAVLHPVIESRSDAVWMSFFTPTSRQWKATPSYFDPQSRTVTADVSHLSWWMPQTWDWRGIEVSLRQSLSALESGRAQESECPGVSGVTLSTTGGDDPPALGCASRVGDEGLAVEITNNRAYAMVIRSPDEAELEPRPYAGFEEYLQSREGTTDLLGGPYLAPTSTIIYTMPLHGEPITFVAAPSWKTRVFDLAAPAATAVFNVVTAGYADCILDTVARSGPAPLGDAPSLVVKCLPVLAQVNAFIIAPVSHFVKSILEDYDLVRDVSLSARGEIRLERPQLPPANLYVRTGYERGALHVYPDFPDLIGINNHEYISNIDWEEPKPSQLVGTGVLNENDCTPACAGGTYRQYRVEITASDPTRCALTVYEDYSDVTRSVESSVFRTITVRALNGSPRSDLVGPAAISGGCV